MSRETFHERSAEARGNAGAFDWSPERSRVPERAAPFECEPCGVRYELLPTESTLCPRCLIPMREASE